jgi:hypothetical protein
MALSSLPVLKSALALAIGAAVAWGWNAYENRPSPNRQQGVCANPRRPPPATIPADLALAQPGASAYDPVEMIKRDVAHGHQIWEREAQAVDQAWAERMNSQLADMLKRRLADYPDAKLEEVQCRLATCRVVLSCAIANGTKATLAMQRPTPAPAFSLGVSSFDGPRFRQEGFFIFSPALRPLARHREWYEGVVTAWHRKTGDTSLQSQPPRP